MKYTELNDFIEDGGLLQHTTNTPGIYAITIDDGIVYVGQSKNVYARCAQHIYHIENAVLNQEKKYLLLLSARLGGHRVDCYQIEICDQDVLTERENYYIEKFEPCLNILTPLGKQDIQSLKIKDVLNKEKCYRKHEPVSIEI